MLALGYNADRKSDIPGPLQQFGTDPTSFILGFVSHYRKMFQKTLTRLAKRTKRNSWTATGTNGKRYTMTLLPQAGDTPAALAMKWLAQARFNALVAGDELIRVAANQPPGKSLDDAVHYDMVSDEMMARWNLFGVDDAILISIAVPVAVGLIGTLLPIMVDMVAKSMDAKVQPPAIKEGTEAPTVQLPPDTSSVGKKSFPWIPLLIVGAAIGGGIYLYKNKD